MNLLFFDTETTGLPGPIGTDLRRQPNVIEFYGVIYNGTTFDKIYELHFKCNPGMKLPENIKKITGITDDDLEFEPTFDRYAFQLQEFFNKSNTIIGHNVAFDIKMIDIEFARMNLKFDWPKIKICTVNETLHLKGHRMNLSSLYEFLFEEPFPGAHRAKADVEALVKCWQRLKTMEVV